MRLLKTISISLIVLLASNFAIAGSLYDKGLQAYEEQDYKKAIKIWEKSAKKDNSPEAMYNLALMYDQGQVVKRDAGNAEK